MSTKINWGVVSFVTIGTIKFIFFSGAYMNFYPCFLYVLSDLNEISYKESQFSAVKQMGDL